MTGRQGSELHRFQIPSLERGKMSFSGNERNHLFANFNGHFCDISGISGLDSAKDSRTFALLDYDRNGMQDLVMLNTNTPVLSLYQNQIGLNHYSPGLYQVAIKFVGGNKTSQPSKFSNRNGYGAKVRVLGPAYKTVREHRCGEGLAAQNSATMIIATGLAGELELSIEWPSGIKQFISAQADQLITVWENIEESPNRKGFEATDYRVRRTPR